MHRIEDFIWRLLAARGPEPRDWLAMAVRMLLGPVGPGITFAAIFFPVVPFALVLLPLAAGIWSGARTARFRTMGYFMVWPSLLATWGLYGLNIGTPGLLLAGATAFVIALGLLAAQIGIVPTTLLVTLIPVFPASPILPLAALLPGFSLPGLFGVITGLAVIEAMRHHRRRQYILLLLTTGLVLWTMGHALIRGHLAVDKHPGWTELSVPDTITKRARWIAVRDLLPDGSTAILGENLFAREDTEARAFWCRAATDRNLTLYPGVGEPHGSATRSAVWRLDARTCSLIPDGAPAVHRATFGIPDLTGSWGPMGSGTGRLAEPGFNWLICVEAFLPWAWAGVLTDTGAPDAATRPVFVLSNDTSFRPLPVLGTPPIQSLRRKAGTAMAGLAGRPVLFAETDRTLLLQDPEGDRHE